MPYAFELAQSVFRLEREVAALRVEVRQLRKRASDDQTELVRAAHVVFGDRAFTAAELLGRALRVDEPGLRLAALLAGRSVRSVGRLLGASAGKPTSEGLILRSAGSARAGTVWLVDDTLT